MTRTSAALRRRVAQLVVIVAVVGTVVATFPGLDEVRQYFAHARPGWLAIAVVAELASALAYVVVLRGVFCPCMRWGHSWRAVPRPPPRR